MSFFASFSKGKTFNHEGYLSLADRTFVEDMWAKVEEEIAIGKPSNFRSAVLNADKILEFVLSKMYPKMSTTGERLKEVKSKFIGNYEIYDGLWFAHKVRNELVHNVNFELPSSQVADIIEKFRLGLQKLGALR